MNCEVILAHRSTYKNDNGVESKLQKIEKKTVKAYLSCNIHDVCIYSGLHYSLPTTEETK